MFRALLSFALLLAATGSAAAVQCSNGADVSVVKYCDLFKYYRKDVRPLDQPIVTSLGGKTTDDVRSFALIIGVSKYKIGGADLPAAEIDVAKLTDLFIDHQRFDEVIVLRNDDATVENIRYFLETYFIKKAAQQDGKSRLVVTYSGHGIGEAGTGSKAGLVLGAANNTSDWDHIVSTATLRAAIEQLASSHFHVLTLINACYGGGVFGLANAATNMGVTYLRGSHALTAGPSDQVVYSKGGPSDGSLFFDALVQAVRLDQADPDNTTKFTDDQGRVLSEIHDGTIRLGWISLYITRRLQDQRQWFKDKGFELWPPLGGPVIPKDQEARGAFFFLTAPHPSVTSMQLPAGVEALIKATALNATETKSDGRPTPRLSALPGRPDIKVFSPPTQYAIRGLDVSRAEGEVDWKRVKSQIFDFAYIRASFREEDPKFQSHWKATREVGLLRGAYHRFDYCKAVVDQAALIQRVVPIEKEALPLAIWVDLPIGAEQQACARAPSPEDLKARVLALLERVGSHYGKVPLVYGVRSHLNQVLDARFNKYMVWFASYPRERTATLSAKDLSFGGSNPWTLWQFTAFETVHGIGENVDVSVFFGNDDQFKSFVQGSENVALTAVSAPATFCRERGLC